MDYSDLPSTGHDIPCDLNLTMANLFACFLGMFMPIMAIIPLAVAIGLCCMKKTNMLQKVVTVITSIFVAVVLVFWIIQIVTTPIDIVTSQG